MDRRLFLGSILAGAVAPAIVRSESLMKMVRRESGIIVFDLASHLDECRILMRGPDLQFGMFHTWLCIESGVVEYDGRKRAIKAGQALRVPNARLYK
jgi:hypothetical protein